jgi:hypothetical protein
LVYYTNKLDVALAISPEEYSALFKVTKPYSEWPQTLIKSGYRGLDSKLLSPSLTLILKLTSYCKSVILPIVITN